MSVFKRAQPAPIDPIAAAALAEARAAEVRAEIERARLVDQLERERAAADREAQRIADQAAEEDRRRRQMARRAQREEDRERRRASRTAFLAKLRPVLPLLFINGGAGYAQAAYAYEEIAPDEWNTPSRVVFALAFALALESIAVYVQWHAHDALLLKAYGTAAKLRRAAWVIAGVVSCINYAHFAKDGEPTPAAVSFGLLSLLSPWLWGLHTRRAQHVQLLAEDAALIDDSGAEFSLERRRAFPIRSWQAKRWSIDNGVQDPREAWRGFKAERAERDAVRAAEKAAEESRAIEPRPAPIQATVSRLPVTELDRVWSAIVSRPGLAHEPAQPALPAPTHEPVPESAHKPTNGARVVAAKSRLTSRRGKRTTVPVEPAHTRLAEAYAKLRASLGREPTGAELAAEAQVSKATANKWKTAQSREDVPR